ncbi:MAG: cytochrome c1 [Acidiferrobacteraceae bacterium]
MRRAACFALLLGLLPGIATADPTLYPVRIDLHNKASLQRGARIFVNYCVSCHSAAYLRYNRMGKDLGIPVSLIKKDMLFARSSVYAHMKAAMPEKDAKKWFGIAPPDLTLETRYRGPSWVYSYLLSFYRDKKTASGWNNLVFPHVAMPDVLYGLQGVQVPVYRTVNGRKVFDHFLIVKAGTMTPAQYREAMHDLVNFMVYMGAPNTLERDRIGTYTLIFLAIFAAIAYLMKREYWKDVH